MELMQINPVFHSLGGYHSCIIRNNPPEQLRYVDAYSILDKIKARRLQPVSCQMSSPKLDAVTKDVLMEDGKDDVHSADDPRYEDIQTELTTIEEKTEVCKREKDWKERRKHDEVDDKIAEFEIEFYLQNADRKSRCDFFFTCWNDCSLSDPCKPCTSNKAYKEANDRETCCADYRLHQIFTRKESMNRMWNVQDSLKIKTEHTSNNDCIIENHVDSSKPTIKLEQAQFWRPKNLPRIMSRRSLLKNPNLLSNTILSAAHSFANPLMNTSSNNSCQESTRTLKNLESDGDSPRSASPQSSVTDEEEVFRSVRINRELKNEKLSDYISEGAASAGRDSSPSDDRRRRKEEDQLPTSILESDIRRYTLSDHCYHQSKSMERLRRETFSETDEEEIDVVSYEKKASYFNFAHKHDANQLAMSNFAQKQHSASQLALNIAQKQQSTNLLTANIDKTTVRRPRGRPPGPNSAKRKKVAQIGLNETSESAPKRTRVQTYPRGQKRQKYAKQWRNQAFEDEDEDDSVKRNLHNDMERQRRISMKNSFDVLKRHVPAIADKDRVAKVNILKQAEVFVKEQQTENHDTAKQLKQVEKQNSILKRRLDELHNEKMRKIRMFRRN